MEIAERQEGAVMIVEPGGRLDSNSAKPFGDRLAVLIGSGSTQLLIDLQHVPYISSAGFRSLLIAGKLIDAAGGKLVLCGMSSEVRRLFEIGAFMELFTICASRDEGVAQAG